VNARREGPRRESDVQARYERRDPSPQSRDSRPPLPPQWGHHWHRRHDGDTGRREQGRPNPPRDEPRRTDDRDSRRTPAPR
jgi:hypothetical protein